MGYACGCDYPEAEAYQVQYKEIRAEAAHDTNEDEAYLTADDGCCDLWSCSRSISGRPEDPGEGAGHNLSIFGNGGP